MAQVTQLLIPDPHRDIPAVFDLQSLAAALNTSPGTLAKCLNNQDSNYSKFWIDKDTKEYVFEYDETRRLRCIEAPKPYLAYIQRMLCKVIFSEFPKHPSNYAYMKGKSAKSAVLEYLQCDTILRLDFKDFFGNHDLDYVTRLIKKNTGYHTYVCKLIAKLATKNGKMPQGAPSSPLLSICLNYDMDVALTNLATQHGLKYCRYADDLIFGGQNLSNSLAKRIEYRVKRIVPFPINDQKTDLMRTSQKKCTLDDGGAYYIQDIRHMLGITIYNERIKATRSRYERLRMDAMRAGLGTINLLKFKGRLAYFRTLEPDKAVKVEAVYNKYKERMSLGYS